VEVAETEEEVGEQVLEAVAVEEVSEQEVEGRRWTSVRWLHYRTDATASKGV
jgi:hypothetical protein